MELFEFYKEQYYRENDRRIEVLNSMNIPVAINSVLVSTLYVFITNFNYNLNSYVNIIFSLLCSMAFIFILISITFLIKSFSDFTKGYEYKGIPYSNELYDWYQKLLEHFKQNNDTQTDVDKYFKEYLISKYAEHTGHNMYVNDQKYEFLYKAKKYLICGIIVTLLLLIPYGLNYFKKVENIGKEHILNQENVPIELL